MRRLFILLAIALQFVALGHMALQREIIARAGQRVCLRTAPIDPRDLFRGDYVRLDYGISTLPEALFRDGVGENRNRKGHEVFTGLRVGTDGTAEAVWVTDREPDEGLFIRGRIVNDWRFRATGRAIRIKYGIEAYFVQQGRGIEMERKMGRRTDTQVPLEALVALGGNGAAVLTGHRWSRLGMGLAVLIRPEGPERRTAVFRLTLANASDEPLAVMAPGDLRFFRLEPVAWAKKEWRPARRGSGVDDEKRGALSESDVVRLAPGGEVVFDLDMADPRWWVTDGGPAVETGTLDQSEMFRVVYQPPAPAVPAGQVDAAVVWQGEMRSRAFHGRGTID